MLAPTGSHVLPGSPQVLSRVGAGWPAGSGLVMNHVVPPAAHSLGRGQGADSRGRSECFQPSLAHRGGCWPRVRAWPLLSSCLWGTHTGSPVSLSLLVQGEASILERKQGLQWAGSTCHPQPSGCEELSGLKWGRRAHHPQSGLNFWSSEG